MPKRIQLPDDFYKHDFKQLAKIEKHPRTRIRFIGLSHIQNKMYIKKKPKAYNDLLSGLCKCIFAGGEECSRKNQLNRKSMTQLSNMKITKNKYVRQYYLNNNEKNIILN
jgi:alpha-galactosidase/6-phospho-beta-glucosidase family protein